LYIVASNGPLRMFGVHRPLGPPSDLVPQVKQWWASSSDELVNGENGMLMTPGSDHLLDRGLVGFADSGDLIVSPASNRTQYQSTPGHRKEVTSRIGVGQVDGRILDPPGWSVVTISR